MSILHSIDLLIMARVEQLLNLMRLIIGQVVKPLGRYNFSLYIGSTSINTCSPHVSDTVLNTCQGVISV